MTAGEESVSSTMSPMTLGTKEQESVVREIRMLRPRWRGLENVKTYKPPQRLVCRLGWILAPDGVRMSV